MAVTISAQPNWCRRPKELLTPVISLVIFLLGFVHHGNAFGGTQKKRLFSSKPISSSNASKASKKGVNNSTNVSAKKNFANRSSNQKKKQKTVNSNERNPTTEKIRSKTRNSNIKKGKNKAKRIDRWPPVTLEAINSGEKVTLRLYDHRGRTIKSAIRQLWHLMRCHATGKRHPIHWRLIRNIYRISRRYPGRTIYIYSGYRSRRVANLRTSYHVKGQAADIRVEGVSNQRLRDYLLANFKPCGVGYYPNSSFVHFDVREKPAFWVDYSGRGESADYATNPYAVLREEKKSSLQKPNAINRDRSGISPSRTVSNSAESNDSSLTDSDADNAGEQKAIGAAASPLPSSSISSPKIKYSKPKQEIDEEDATVELNGKERPRKQNKKTVHKTTWKSKDSNKFPPASSSPLRSAGKGEHITAAP